MQAAMQEGMALLQVRLALRADLRCTLQTSAGSAYYQVEDPLTNHFYRIGVREWAVVSRLDGRTPLIAAALAGAKERSEEAMSAQDVVSLARWLIQTQLAKVADATCHPMYVRPPGRKAAPAWLNPAFIKIPLFNPDRLLARCLPWCRWMLTSVAFTIWCCTLLYSLGSVYNHWDDIALPLSTILAPDNWLYLLGVWVGLKAVHEFFHGIVCKKYGGRVPSCGLMLIMFSPVAFVDVTSSWRFRSKWQRIFTAAAGMYIELFVAALATQIWLYSESPVVRQVCHNLMTMASISTLLFNGNFLMRFDGYYIFSDLVEIQNLYGSGQTYVRYLARRYLLGVPATPLVAPTWQRRFTKCYAVASLFWRIAFYIGVVLTSATLFHGAGIVISLMIGLMWIVLPAVAFLRYLVRGQGTEQPRRLRFGLLVGGAALLVPLSLCLPWPGGVVAVGVVDYEPLSVVRATTPGFLRTLHVQPEQDVAAGTPLAQVENRELASERRRVEAEIEISQKRVQDIQSRVREDSARRIELTKEQLTQKTLQIRQNDLAHKEEELTIVAPCNGRVVGRDFDALYNQHLSEGESILAIGNEDAKAILVTLTQRDADFFLQQVGRTPHVRVKGRLSPVLGAVLKEVNPRATKRLTHPSLAAMNGGPLAVAYVGKSGNANEDPYELLEPHFQAVVSLPAEVARELRAGELAKIRIAATGESIGGYLWKRFESWIGKKLKAGDY